MRPYKLCSLGAPWFLERVRPFCFLRTLGSSIGQDAQRDTWRDIKKNLPGQQKARPACRNGLRRVGFAYGREGMHPDFCREMSPHRGISTDHRLCPWGST